MWRLTVICHVYTVFNPPFSYNQHTLAIAGCEKSPRVKQPFHVKRYKPVYYLYFLILTRQVENAIGYIGKNSKWNWNDALVCSWHHFQRRFVISRATIKRRKVQITQLKRQDVCGVNLDNVGRSMADNTHTHTAHDFISCKLRCVTWHLSNCC